MVVDFLSPSWADHITWQNRDLRASSRVYRDDDGADDDDDSPSTRVCRDWDVARPSIWSRKSYGFDGGDDENSVVAKI